MLLSSMHSLMQETQHEHHEYRIISENPCKSSTEKREFIDVTWVCLKIGYIPNYSHLVGIMISKTIGFRGTRHFQTNPHRKSCSSWPGSILPTLDDFRTWGDGQSTAWRRQMGPVKTHFDRGKLLSDMDRHGRGELQMGTRISDFCREHVMNKVGIRRVGCNKSAQTVLGCIVLNTFQCKKQDHDPRWRMHVVWIATRNRPRSHHWRYWSQLALKQFCSRSGLDVPFILRVNAGKARQSISPFYS